MLAFNIFFARSTSLSPATVVVPAVNDRIIVTMNGILDDALSGLLLLCKGIDSNNDSKNHCMTQSSNDSSTTPPSNESNATPTSNDSSGTPTSSPPKKKRNRRRRRRSPPLSPPCPPSPPHCLSSPTAKATAVSLVSAIGTFLGETERKP